MRRPGRRRGRGCVNIHSEVRVHRGGASDRSQEVPTGWSCGYTRGMTTIAERLREEDRARLRKTTAEVDRRIPLLTSEAQRLWKRLRDAG